MFEIRNWKILWQWYQPKNKKFNLLLSVNRFKQKDNRFHHHHHHHHHYHHHHHHHHHHHKKLAAVPRGSNIWREKYLGWFWPLTNYLEYWNKILVVSASYFLKQNKCLGVNIYLDFVTIIVHAGFPTGFESEFCENYRKRAWEKVSILISVGLDRWKRKQKINSLTCTQILRVASCLEISQFSIAIRFENVKKTKVFWLFRSYKIEILTGREYWREA